MTAAVICKENLAETVRMFLNMHLLGINATRAWSITHNVLYSALVLGIVGETRTNPNVRKLQGDLINVLSVLASGDGETASNSDAGVDITLTRPHSRALHALKKIHEFDWPSSQRKPESLPNHQNIPNFVHNPEIPQHQQASEINLPNATTTNPAIPQQSDS
jgi:hypothetical protein